MVKYYATFWAENDEKDLPPDSFEIDKVKITQASYSNKMISSAEVIEHILSHFARSTDVYAFEIGEDMSYITNRMFNTLYEAKHYVIKRFWQKL